jgi:hypothetical protein
MSYRGILPPWSGSGWFDDVEVINGPLDREDGYLVRQAADSVCRHRDAMPTRPKRAGQPPSGFTSEDIMTASVSPKRGRSTSGPEAWLAESDESPGRYS